MEMTEKFVATPHGPGRLQIWRARKTMATVVLSHGAGRGIDTYDLLALARGLVPHRITVMLFEQPWVAQGRKMAPAPKMLDEALRAAVDTTKTNTPLILGGRSAGARSAARIARDLAASGCLALAFPLHPPGRPEKSRLSELAGSGVPTLVVQGERDPMGRPEEFPDPLPPRVSMAVVPGGDHSLVPGARSKVSREEAGDLIVQSTLEWIVRDVVGV